MLNLVTNFFVKILGQALPFAIRWHYKPEKLAGQVKVRVRESGDGIVIAGGKLPQARAWLRITNLSPFPIVVDRIFGNFWYGPQLAAYSNLKQCTVPPSDEVGE